MKKGRNKQKKRANKNRSGATLAKALVTRSNDEEMYGQVSQAVGNCNLKVRCHDGLERVCHIRGAIQKKERIRVDDYVLVNIREFQKGKGDIIHLYAPENIRQLRNIPAEKPFIEALREGKAGNNNDINVVFEEKGKEDKDSNGKVIESVDDLFETI
jgi:translation initiation factor 1A